jgi:phage host-nuclease inhibitor protein Gam
VRISNRQGGFTILEESDPEETLNESMELNNRSSEIISGKLATVGFLTRLGIYIKIMAMRYLRILKKADFEEFLEKDKTFHELRRSLDSLNRERTEAKGKLSIAGTGVAEYRALSASLTKLERVLDKTYSNYVEARNNRARFVKDMNTVQKGIYDEAREDIEYYSKRFNRVDKEIQDVQKAIQSYKAAKYNELVSQRVKTKSRDDH